MLVYCLIFLVYGLAFAKESDWSERLQGEFAAIDAESDGALGVYVKRLGDGEEASYQGERAWYLSSTTKVPVAVFLLRQVERGEISLDQEAILKETDFVDGAGELQRMKPGTRVSVRRLLRNMLVQSDSSATDILVRLLGEEALNDFLEEMGGFSRFTTILQVRFDAYGELHPKATSLTNLDFIALKREKGFSRRRAAFARKIGVDEEDLQAPSLEEAFERYYRRGINSGSLTGYGKFLERLVRGELLSSQHTKLLLSHMQSITTGERRLKAGFPEGAVFAQKTGTQVRRICNMGVLDPVVKRVVIAACVEKFSNQAAAERVLRRVGAVIGSTEKKYLRPARLSASGM